MGFQPSEQQQSRIPLFLKGGDVNERTAQLVLSRVLHGPMVNRI